MGVKWGRVKWRVTSGERGCGDTPTPLFCNKRLQVTENKGSEREKERQERTRGGKPLTAKDLKTRPNTEGTEAGGPPAGRAGTEHLEENNRGQRR